MTSYRSILARPVVVAVAAALALTACGQSGGDNSTGAEAKGGGTYEFGVMVPLTGPASAIGENFRRGVDLAVSQINAAGGAGGMQLKPVYQDHLGTAQGGAAAANKLINLQKLPYVLSSFSSVTLAVAPVAARSKVLVINNGGTDDALLNLPFVYNNQMMNRSLLPPLLEYMKKGATTAALLTSDDAYGTSGRETYKDTWSELGGEIVADEVFSATGTDVSSQLKKIKAANPDVLFTMAIGESFGLVAKQARAAGITAQIAGPLAVEALIKVGGKAAEGVTDAGIAVDPDAKSPAARTYLDAYQSAHGEMPDWVSCTMHESVFLLQGLIEAVKKTGGDTKSGADLQKALEANPSFPNRCADGDITFRDDHSVRAAVAIRKVANGKFVTQEIVVP
ncbi:MAG: branched-chain amino acid transport system substrate-binding protein [Actinomycetota bacterium]|nr:branched-chain amino acid transport system substrate-binding protein [Actinomycetota bacterium]